MSKNNSNRKKAPRTPDVTFIVTNHYRSATEEERQKNLQNAVTQYLSHRLSQQNSEDGPLR